MDNVLDFDAVILAGGRGSRLGGIDKAALEIGGARLVDRTVAAAQAAGAARIVVVGPDHAARGATDVVREEPALSGPLAAALAGLELVTSPRVMLLACDLVNPSELCALLVAESLDAGRETSVLIKDDDGYPQWLAGMHDTATLQLTARQIDVPEHEPLKRLFAESTIRFVRASTTLTRDIDTPEDLRWARGWKDLS